MGALTDRKAATLPVVAAIIASIVPALIYLAINRGAAANGWSVPTATDIAFALGVLALLGERVPPGLRVFVAAFAVVDDIVSVLILAVFYPHNFEAVWLIAAARRDRDDVRAEPLARLCDLALRGDRGRGLVLPAFLRRAWRAGRHRPCCVPADASRARAAGPLLAQAATALAALEHAQSEHDEGEDNPVLEWASRNLSAASERLLSPADRIEQAIAPWSTYLILPLFAFSATGVGLSVDLSSPARRAFFWA